MLIAINYTLLDYKFSVESKHIWIVYATLTSEAPWHHMWCRVGDVQGVVKEASNATS